MKQLTVISGKGGTGKTSLAAAFASLAHDLILADCDVDAADLHLVIEPTIKESREFHGLEIAVRDASLCIDCGECHDNCRFDAVNERNEIISESCEGCAVCERICPVQAIHMEDRVSGMLYISDTRFGPMAHAELFIGEEATGMLVSMVREAARDLATEHEKELVLIDGPPGIGCPVIAAIGGVDLVCVVTEPTVSGVHDLDRVLDVADHFGIAAMVVINRHDLNLEMSSRIIEHCDERGVEVIGRIPYDNIFTQAMIQERSVVELGDSKVADTIRSIWSRLEAELLDG
jgi:MinD superfamily P-loop ATPase